MTVNHTGKPVLQALNLKLTSVCIRTFAHRKAEGGGDTNY